MRANMLICCMGIMLNAGCGSVAALKQETATPQVASKPFTPPAAGVVQTSVNYAPASQDTAVRVELVGRKLIGENPQAGLRPTFVAIGSADPEIFHVGLATLYVTEALVKQCQTDGQLTAVLANELGRMISEREAAVADDVRRPEPVRPIHLPIGGNGNTRDADPMYLIEMAKFEKEHRPQTTQKLPPPNPQLVARSLLEHAGYQRTELDNAMPLLENAARFSTLANQFNGTLRQGDWKQP